MYERYAALFALRNHGEEAAVNAIVTSLAASSALLRHEVREFSSISIFSRKWFFFPPIFLLYKKCVV